MAEGYIERLHAEMTKNVAYDNRLAILDCLAEIVQSKVEISKFVVRSKQKMFHALYDALPAHLKREF